MRRLFLPAVIGLMASGHVAADTQAEPHSVAVAGQAELLIPPDYALIDLGVISQAAAVGDALADNDARMTRGIDAIKSLGIPDKDIRTSTFIIQPKYEKMESREYDVQQFRTIVGYYISNKVRVKVSNLANVAKVIDDCVKAGANASGDVEFMVDSLTAHMDDARRKAVEDAHHKAQVLTDASHMTLGPALSIIDNQAETAYDGAVHGSYGYGAAETVVVTASRLPTPVEPGLVSLTSKVTVVYSAR